MREHFLLLLSISVAPFLVVAFGIRFGSVLAIRLFRGLAYLAFLAGVGDLTTGVLIAGGVLGFQERMSRDGGLYICFCSLVLIALSSTTIFKMRRVRWLDPSSRPEEWETPFNRKARTSMDEYLKSGRR